MKLKKQGECEMNRMKVELEALVARVKAQGEQVAVPSFGVENSQVYQAQAHDEPEAKGGSRRSNRTGNEPQQLKRSVLYKKVVLDSKMYQGEVAEAAAPQTKEQAAAQFRRAHCRTQGVSSKLSNPVRAYGGAENESCPTPQLHRQRKDARSSLSKQISTSNLQTAY